jgi:hypothetical protein
MQGNIGVFYGNKTQAPTAPPIIEPGTIIAVCGGVICKQTTCPVFGKNSHLLSGGNDYILHMESIGHPVGLANTIGRIEKEGNKKRFKETKRNGANQLDPRFNTARLVCSAEITTLEGKKEIVDISILVASKTIKSGDQIITQAGWQKSKSLEPYEVKKVKYDLPENLTIYQEDMKAM